MAKCTGLLLETVSIQRYIFQSNKLKTNLGASFLIQHKIFGKLLEKAISDTFPEKTFDFTAWKTDPSEIRIEKEPFEVGYMGGGNALLFFREEEAAKAFLRKWTMALLIETPGVKTAAAIGPFDPRDFKKSNDALFMELRKNKGRYVPQTTLPRHGITAECSQSGLSAETFIGNDPVSAVICAKQEASDAAKKQFQELFAEQLQEQFCFSDEFEKLGSISGEESRISVVHIDGNRMAKRFMNAETLEEMRKLSKSVHEATRSAFSDLVAHGVQNYKELMKDLGFDPQRTDRKQYGYPTCEDRDKNILPITPIVIGGDDVTFVCDGRLGIHFARIFIEAFQQKRVADGKRLTACAGIAITKVKYPFYRGYQLAEELCDSAKKENGSKEEAETLESFLNFQISTGAVFGSLDQIVKQYNAPRGALLYRPYKLIPKEKDMKGQSLETMLALAGELKKLPNSRINELGRVLTQSEESGELFLKQWAFRGRKLPEMKGRYFHEKLFDSNKTIYFDMIELSKYYPESRLTPKGGQ